MLQELDGVHRLAYHLAGSANEADDLVQETYLRAFKSRNTFQLPEHSPRPWLFKILHNVSRTRLGKRGGEATAGGDDLGDQVAAPPDPPPVEINWEQVDEWLKRAI